MTNHAERRSTLADRTERRIHAYRTGLGLAATGLLLTITSHALLNHTLATATEPSAPIEPPPTRTIYEGAARDKISVATRAAFAGNPVLEKYFKEFGGTSVDFLSCKTAAEFNGDYHISIAVIGDKEKGNNTHSVPGESAKTRVGTIDAGQVKTVRDLVIETNWGSKIVYGVLGNDQSPEFVMMRSQSGDFTKDHISSVGLDECLADAGTERLVRQNQPK